MSYESGEALIKTQIAALGKFNSDTVTQKDWGVLRTGKAAVYAILRPGAYNVEWFGDSKRLTTYITYCEVWQRYVDDSTTANNLVTRGDEIRDRIDQYRKLGDTNNTIVDATVRSGDEPQPMFQRNRSGRTDGPFWLRQTHMIAWKEQETITFAE